MITVPLSSTPLVILCNAHLTNLSMPCKRLVEETNVFNGAIKSSLQQPVVWFAEVPGQSLGRLSRELSLKLAKIPLSYIKSPKCYSSEKKQKHSCLVEMLIENRKSGFRFENQKPVFNFENRFLNLFFKIIFPIENCIMLKRNS